MKKKLKIPATQLIQDSELTELEKGKETLNDELSNCKANILKFANDKKEWEKGNIILIENVKVLIRKNRVT